MGRHMGATLKASGIGRTLRARGFARSQRFNPTNRKDQRVTVGFRVFEGTTDAVKVIHVLGEKHGLVRSVDKIEAMNTAIDQYAASLSDRFVTSKHEEGTEDVHLLVREKPDPKVGEILRMAASKLKMLGDHRGSRQVADWADLADQGQPW